MCWLITLNGATLSKDMAQRVIPIKLTRPVYRPTWESDVRNFARDHRWEILADAIGILQSNSQDFAASTRWAPWEQEVLAKTATPRACQELIAARQGAVDDDGEEQALIADHFRGEIRRCNHEPDGACLSSSRQSPLGGCRGQQTSRTRPTGRPRT